MFKNIYRIKEINKNGKTTHIVQQRYFLFWWNLSDEIEDKKIAEGLKVLLEFREKYS